MGVQLFSAATFSPFWDEPFLPWARQASARALRTGGRAVAIVPCRNDSYWLKTRLLETGTPNIGIDFATPAELRDLLAKHLGLRSRMPLREHLHLLLSIAAESELASTPLPAPAMLSVAAEPDALLRAIDQLSAGGWTFAEGGPAPLRPAVQKFHELMAACGFDLMHDMDRALRERAKKSADVFSDVFVAGFSGAHWPLWALLSAAVESADQATVCLMDPRMESQEIDAAWIGTWEDRFGSARPSETSFPSPFTELTQLPEGHAALVSRRTQPMESVDFLVGKNTLQQARAIVARAIEYLARPDCARIGILFPGPGALARLVSTLLGAQQIPHNDSIAHVSPGPFERPDWYAWLELQENPRLHSLIRLARNLPSTTLFGEDIPLASLEQTLSRAFSEVLIDDLSVLAEVLDGMKGLTWPQQIAAGLRQIPILPTSASFPAYVQQTVAIFSRLGWEKRSDEIQRLSSGWSQSLTGTVSRRAFLRWVREVLVSFRSERSSMGNHPYGRLHLLTYPQAETQVWSHLILAGLNENAWPQTIGESSYIDEEEITQLNSRIRQLNEKGLSQGAQGEGHVAMQQGKTLCLGPTEKRAMSLRQLLNTLESTSAGVTLCASLYEESNPSQPLNPSEYFNRLYFSARGKALSSATIAALAEETMRWLQSSELWGRPAADTESVKQTRQAFDERRNPNQPFGPYEFALGPQTAHFSRTPLALSATDWEKALRFPAATWMRQLLGVAPRENFQESDPSKAAIGQWVHRWLRRVSHATRDGQFFELPGGPEILQRTRNAATHFHENIRETLKRANRDHVPDWWISNWRRALAMATTFAEKLAGATQWSHGATEYALERVHVPVGDDATLQLHGRIDLILAKSASGTGPDPDELWIIDYKTGSHSPFKRGSGSAESTESKLLKRFAKGDGLQLALYALALQKKDAKPVGFSLLTSDETLDAPQLTHEHLTGLGKFWLGLHRMQNTGVFGMRGGIRGEYAFGPDYPLATLEIMPEILRRKWELTHPLLALLPEEIL
jgi:RecB family exonuclease